MRPSWAPRPLWIVPCLWLGWACASPSPETVESSTEPPSGALQPLPAWDDLGVEDPKAVEAFADRHGRVQRLLESAGTVDPLGMAWAWGQLGMLYQAYLRFEPALVCYGNAGILDPLDARWPYYSAHIDRVEGRFEEAQRRLEQARALRPEDPVMLLWQASILLELGRPAAAKGLFTEVLEKRPGHVSARRALGDSALQEGAPERAIEILEPLHQERPKVTSVVYALGQAYSRAGRLEDAERILSSLAQRALDQVPLTFEDPWMQEVSALREGAQQHARLGMKALAQNRLNVAIVHLSRALQVDPNRADVVYNLAAALLRTGRRQEGLAHLEQAVGRFPNHVLSRVLWGRTLLGAGDVVAAEQQARAAVEVDPRSSAARRLWGEIYLHKQLFSEAVEAYGIAAELDPGEPQAVVGQVIALTLADRRDEAVTVVEAGVDHFPTSIALRGLRLRLWAFSEPRGSSAELFAQMGWPNEDFSAVRSIGLAETVAMALASLGRYDEAFDWQSKVVAALGARASRHPWSISRSKLYGQGRQAQSAWSPGERWLDLPLGSPGTAP